VPDPASHEPDKSASRSAFNGLAQALVQTTFKRGKIEIKAQSPGLKAASVSLDSR
jgi:beta-galactosidase